MDRLTFTDEEMKKIGEDFACPIKSNSDDENDIVTRFCDRVCDEFQHDCPFEKVGKALKAYEDTGITPDQMSEISDEYRKVCEELAELFYSLINLEDKIKFCKNKTECEDILDAGKTIPDSMCKKCLVEWLQSEVEE